MDLSQVHIRHCIITCMLIHSFLVFSGDPMLFDTMPIKEGWCYYYHEVQDIGRALWCCHHDDHCSTNRDRDASPNPRSQQVRDRGSELVSTQSHTQARGHSSIWQTGPKSESQSLHLLSPLIMQLLVHAPSLLCSTAIPRSRTPGC